MPLPRWPLSRPAAAGIAAAAVTATTITFSAQRRAQAAAAATAVAAARSAGERERFARAVGASPHRSTLLAFYAPSCGLCRSIREDVREVTEEKGEREERGGAARGRW